MIKKAIVGTERFLVWMTSTNEGGEPFEWCVAHEDSEKDARGVIATMRVSHSSCFASEYRFERVVIADPGASAPFVGTAKPATDTAEPNDP